jgi:hypothetical protein
MTVRIASVPAEILILHLINTTLGYYCYTSLFSNSLSPDSINFNQLGDGTGSYVTQFSKTSLSQYALLGGRGWIFPHENTKSTSTTEITHITYIT